MLASEEAAVAIFRELGEDGVRIRLSELSKRARMAYDAAPSIPNGWTSFDFMTEEQKTERYFLLLALTLCVDEVAEAKTRLQLRRALR